MPLFAPYSPDVRGVVDEGIVVRPAGAHDVAGVVVVAESRGPQAEGYADRVAGWVDDPAPRVLVADRDGAVVGWAMAGPRADGPDAPAGYYVGALTVLPEGRRRGAGDRLLAGLCDWTWGRATRLWSVVNARNLASIAVHRRHGFDEVDRGPAFAGVTFTGGEGVLLRADRPPATPPRAARGER